jgi:flagellar biosynthesis/type III secretory pathway protein FliH
MSELDKKAEAYAEKIILKIAADELPGCNSCLRNGYKAGYEEGQKDKELEIEYWKSRLSELCDQAWGQVYPGKTDWEYAAQAVRHLMQENDELKAKLPPAPKESE